MYPIMNPMMNPQHNFPIVFPQHPKFTAIGKNFWRIWLIISGFLIGLISLAQIEISTYRYIILKERGTEDLILMISLVVLGVLHAAPSITTAILAIPNKSEIDNLIFQIIKWVTLFCLVVDIFILAFVSVIFFMGRDGDFKELTQALFMISLVYFGVITIGMLTFIVILVSYQFAKYLSEYHRVGQIELMPRYPTYPIY